MNITLIRSEIQSKRPDLLDLSNFEQYCAKNSGWKSLPGATLFSPIRFSTRLYTLLHSLLSNLLKRIKKEGAVISIGLPYKIWLYSKNFPYFSFTFDLKVLWTYDVWEPKYGEFELLVRESKVNLLLLTSHHATEHFKSLGIPNCKVHWIPESVNIENYRSKNWKNRKIDILSFGRAFQKYHHAIKDGCLSQNISYKYEEISEERDVAVSRVNPKSLQFSDWKDFIYALSDSKICLCFHKAMTHPKHAGKVSTLTLRYLQAMASKCLIIGSIPFDMELLFGYQPVIEVDWSNPVEQIKNVLANYASHESLIERNYATLINKFHHKNAMNQIDNLVKQEMLIRSKS